MNRIQYLIKAFCLFVVGLQSVNAAPNVDMAIKAWHESGAKVYFVQKKELPILDVRLVFDAGSARDTNLKGLALFTNQMIGESAAKLSSVAIAKAFDDLGVRFGKDAYRDMSIVTLKTLTREDILTPALALFTQVLGQPTFKDKDIERNRKLLLTILNQKEQAPAHIATQAFFNQLYQGHPYSNPTLGIKQDIANISAKHLQDFYRQYFVRENLVIALVGDVSVQKAKAIAKQIVLSLKTGMHAKELPLPTLSSKASLQKIPFSSVQTHIHMGVTGIERGNPRHPILYVGNHILGGSGLQSHLMDRVRVKQGLTYGVWSYFIPMRTVGPFILSLQTRTSMANKALHAVRAAYAEFVSEGPSKQELQEAKQQIFGELVHALSTNQGIVNQVSSIGFYDLPLDHVNRFLSAIDTVTIEQIQQEFNQLLAPEKMQTIMVGKLAEASSTQQVN